MAGRWGRSGAGAAVVLAVLGAGVALAPPAAAATFVVSTLADAGDGSLRDALADAAANAGADMVTFQAGLNGTISLESGLPPMGEVTITGPGPDLLTVDGAATHQVFDATGGGQVVISGLTVANGRGANNGGGAVRGSDTHVTLSDVALAGNFGGPGLDGGAVWVAGGVLRIVDSTLFGNTANGDGGAVAVLGGALEVTRTTIEASWASGGGASVENGGAIYVDGATTTVTDSMLLGNSASMGGGAIYAVGSPVSVTGSYFEVNWAVGGGGGAIAVSEGSPLVVTDSTFVENLAGGDGGAIDAASPDSSVSIVGSTLVGNRAGDLSASNGGALSVTSAEVAEPPQVLIDSSTFEANRAPNRGGAIYLDSVVGRVVSSTVSDNSANDGGGTGSGAGIYLAAEQIVATPFEVAHSTIADNRAANEGGGIASDGPLTLDHSIVATNTAPTGPDLFTNAVQPIPLSYSLVGSTAGVAVTADAGSLLDVDPQLGVLADNGGPTRTHLPGAGSPAVDAGDPNIAAAPGDDQRGRSRIVGAAIDMGAVEVQPPPPPPPPPEGPGDPCPDDPAALPFTDVDPASVHAPAIGCLLALGITTGTTATTFDPSGPVRRGQAASFISRVLERAGADLPVDPPDAFDDDDDSVHEAAIDGLAALAIVQGTTPRTFDPSEPLSRAQMASLVVRAYEHVTGDARTPTTDHFTDDEGSVHEAAIDIAADLGIVLGAAPGTFEPGAPIRRDQTASILVRLVARLAAAVTT